MKYFISFIILIIIIAIPLSSFSQEKPRKLKRMAKKAYSREDFYTAKFYYESYCFLRPDKLSSKNRLAELQYYTRDHKKACLNYQDLYRKDKESYPMASFFAAKSYQMSGMYDTAITYYNAFIDDFDKDFIDIRYKKLCKIGIEGCNYSILFKDSLLKLAVIHLDTSINKAYNEFSPIPIDDKTLWFAGIQSDTLLDRNEKVQKQFFKAYKKDNNNWVNQGMLNLGFNDPTVTTGNGSMSPSGVRFFFTRCEKNMYNNQLCNLYMSEKVNDKWEDPIILPINVNNLEYTSTQPSAGSYSKNMSWEIIYFASDRPGGKGGYDIWYTTFNKHYKSFSDARPLGSSINGPGDEKTPFYDSRTRTLYFSSDSYPGYGGLDIFKSSGERRNWTTAENMNIPVNSSYDDIYFVTLNKERGYFVSNRDGGIAFENENCCDDIYSFRWTSYIHYAVSGKVIELPEDKVDYQSVNEAIAEIFIVDEELDEDMSIGQVFSDKNGNFLIDIEVGRFYKMVVSKEGYFSKSYEFNTESIDYSDTLYQEFIMQKIPEKPIVLNNIYFEFNSANLVDSAKISLDTTLIVLLNDNPDIKIKIEAHTDSKGIDKYNLELSKRRASSIANYLIMKGIKGNRLVSQGYGESRPIAPNKNSDGSDNPEGRQLNRRIEFVVIKK